MKTFVGIIMGMGMGMGMSVWLYLYKLCEMKGKYLKKRLVL